MFRNYITIAFRNLTRNKITSFINIGGLAVGMAVAFLIGLWIFDEISFDKQFDNYEHIAKIRQNTTVNDNTQTGKAVPIPLAGELRTQYGNHFKYVVNRIYTKIEIRIICCFAPITGMPTLNWYQLKRS